jgi:GNAT superfamily N-acetyltransferase
MSILLKSLYLFSCTLFAKPKPLPLVLSDFYQHKVVTDDFWNKKTNGNVLIKFFDVNDVNDIKQKNKIGYISYRVKVGQVGLFFLDKEYQNRGLGKQILTQVIEDMKSHNVTEIWAVTTKEHPFWSNVFNKSFSFYDSRQLHPSVTGFGYKMRI